MKENILNLPLYLRRLPRVYSEQVALAMTGEYVRPLLRDVDQYQEAERWRAASSYHSCILCALRTGKIKAIATFSKKGGPVASAFFASDDIWPWALAELSDTSPWYGAESGTSGALVLPSTEITPPPVSSIETYKYLVIALSRLLIATSHSAYLYGEKPNKSALARNAAAEIAYALPPDADKTESFRKALSEAFSLLPSDVMPLNK